MPSGSSPAGRAFLVVSCSLSSLSRLNISYIIVVFHSSICDEPTACQDVCLNIFLTCTVRWSQSLAFQLQNTYVLSCCCWLISMGCRQRADGGGGGDLCWGQQDPHWYFQGRRNRKQFNWANWRSWRKVNHRTLDAHNVGRNEGAWEFE